MRIAVLIAIYAMTAVCAADELLRREDFDKITDGSLPAGWTADGDGWSVQAGRLHGVAETGGATLLFGPSDARDVALAADITFIKANDDKRWAALLLREGGPDAPGVQFTARYDAKRGNGLELATRQPQKDGGQWRVFQTAAAPADFLDQRTHRLRIEARGDWIRTFFDEQKVFECPRGGDVNAAGRVGFRLSGVTVAIDNVEVKRLDPMNATDLHKLRTRPLVIAHRGFSFRAPENTLASYRLAIEAGADMAECDVWLTADGVPVLLHDGNLKRTAGLDAKVGTLPLAEVQKLDAGSWKDAQFAGERIPTLREALELVRGHLRFVIEIKQTGMEEQVIAAINEAGVSPVDVMIFCFKREVVEAIVRLEPRLPTTWLVGDMPWQPAERRQVLAEALQARVSALGLPLTRVDPAIVRLAQESGLPVFVWTVDEPADMRYLIRVGVDAIITNRPDLAFQTIGQQSE